MQVVYPYGFKKAITLSYDDGIEQDRRMISLLNEYGLKATFNVSSGLLDETSHWQTDGVVVARLKSRDLKAVYEHHEVACHGVTHPNICELSSEQKVYQIVQDKQTLEALLGYSIKGMAYPFGCVDDEMIEIMKHAGLLYGRLASSSQTFELPTNPYHLVPTCHHDDTNIFELISHYKTLRPETLTLFYLWGHSYEFDVNQNWSHLREICLKLNEIEDSWRCTTGEWFTYMNAIKQIEINKEQKQILNHSTETIWITYQKEVYRLSPHTSLSLR